MSQAKEIQKIYDDLATKASSLEAKVSNLEKTKANLENDIKILSQKKQEADTEYADINGTIKEAIKIALEKREKELDDLIGQNKEKARQLNEQAAQYNSDKQDLANSIKENQKKAENLANSQKACDALSNELHQTKNNLVSLAAHIVENVKNA